MVLKAAYKGHKEVVDVLLANGAQIEAATKSGFTALHMACGKGHLNVASSLLAQNAYQTTHSLQFTLLLTRIYYLTLIDILKHATKMAQHHCTLLLKKDTLILYFCCYNTPHLQVSI